MARRRGPVYLLLSRHQSFDTQRRTPGKGPIHALSLDFLAPAFFSLQVSRSPWPLRLQTLRSLQLRGMSLSCRSLACV